MNKTILIILISIFAISCDKEDSEVQCDCDITIASYNEAMQAYELISQEFYSNNCQDHKPFYNPVGDGTYYSINCK
jgi:hypothetical protein